MRCVCLRVGLAEGLGAGGGASVGAGVGACGDPGGFGGIGGVREGCTDIEIHVNIQ